MSIYYFLLILILWGIFVFKLIDAISFYVTSHTNNMQSGIISKEIIRIGKFKSNIVPPDGENSCIRKIQNGGKNVRAVLVLNNMAKL